MVDPAFPIGSIDNIPARLAGRFLISTEFMYRPRPDDPRERHVFDFTLASRLAELSRYERAAALFICNSAPTIDSLAYLRDLYPHLTLLAAVANPEPIAPTSGDPYADTPRVCGWDAPEKWVRYSMTDRWARITFALNIARQLDGSGYLIMPANDVVMGDGLLRSLVRFSQHQVKQGLPAAVSPYTYHQHSTVPDVAIPQDVIDALNAAFARDSWLRWRFQFGHYQSFWGKMGMLPFGMCGEILDRVETMMFEDDLEIDAVIREAGYAVHCKWIDRPSQYRQALPVFSREDLKPVIERTLHYSLAIPGKFYGEKSQFNQPLDRLGRLKMLLSPRFARAVAISESVIAECNGEIARRVDQVGMSWTDWGMYRYVVRIGDPLVQVWKCL